MLGIQKREDSILALFMSDLGQFFFGGGRLEAFVFLLRICEVTRPRLFFESMRFDKKFVQLLILEQEFLELIFRDYPSETCLSCR
jgi:hypothetical protein